MLGNKRITIVAETVVDGEKIASYGAVLDAETHNLTMTSRNINAEACKINRETIRADRAEFEDYAYQVQDLLRSGD